VNRVLRLGDGKRENGVPPSRAGTDRAVDNPRILLVELIYEKGTYHAESERLWVAGREAKNGDRHK